MDSIQDGLVVDAAPTSDSTNLVTSGGVYTAVEGVKNYTDTKISDLINSAPTTLDTLGEIATAMAENATVVEALDTAIGTKANASDLSAIQSELSNKSDIDHTHEQYLTEIPSEYVTETELEAKGYLTAVPEEYITETGLQNKDYATNSTLNTIQSELSNKADSDHTHEQYLTEIPSEYITETELEAKGYLTAVPEEYVTETELLDMGYASDATLTNIQAELDNKADVEHTHEQYLTEIPEDYVTETGLEAKGYLTAIPEEYITETELVAKDYATNTALSNLQAEVDSIQDGLVTDSAPTSGSTNLVTSGGVYTAVEGAKTYMDTKIADLINSAPTTLDTLGEIATAMEENASVVEALDAAIGTKANASDLAAVQAELANKADVDHTHEQYLTEIPSEYVTETELEAKGYLTDIPEEYVTETELSEMGYASDASLSAIQSELSNKSDIDHTHEQYLTEIPSEYITETELEAKGYLTAIPEEYITETELTAKDYATSSTLSAIQSELSNKSDIDHTHEQYLTEIPEEYVTETELEAKGYLTSIPEEYVTDTELTAKDYATNTVLSALQTEVDGKADEGHTHEQYLTEVPSEYITETELTAKGYATESALTELQNEVDGKADAEHTHEQYLTEIPEEYVTETELIAKDYATNTALSGKQDTLTFDSTPTSGSTNPVTSDGIYAALQSMESTLGDVGSILDSINGEVV